MSQTSCLKFSIVSCNVEIPRGCFFVSECKITNAIFLSQSLNSSHWYSSAVSASKFGSLNYLRKSPLACSGIQLFLSASPFVNIATGTDVY